MTDKSLTECYCISGDRVTFNGKAFDFSALNLGDFICHRSITVDPKPKSFFTRNEEILKINRYPLN